MASQATAKYRTAYCRQCVAAGEAGYSLAAFAGMIGVTRTTIDRWSSRHKGFAEAVDAHRCRRAKFWEDQLLRIARDGGKTGSATAVMFVLRNIAPEEYSDRAAEEQSGKNGGATAQITEHVLSDDSAEKLKRILE